MIQISDLSRWAIDTWGEEAQVNMAVEECAELICAIAQDSRGRDNIDVAGEIADVIIMMEQLRLIYDGVDEALALKRNRLEEKLYEEAES